MDERDSTVVLQPQEAFTMLLKRLTPTLRQHGFARRRQTFFRHEHGNWGIVNFQKSMYSTGHEVRFTINLGIFSQRIGSPFRAPGGGVPSISICHWSQRIGRLLPDRQDHWWTISGATSLNSLAEEI